MSFLATEHFAFIGRFFADDHPEKRGFAGAVRADETNLFTGIELKRCIDKENLPAVLLADTRERNHPVSIPDMEAMSWDEMVKTSLLFQPKVGERSDATGQSPNRREKVACFRR